MRSDHGPVTSSASPSPSVVTETVSVLSAAETPKSADSSVNTAWVLYTCAKVASPAAKSAPTTRR